MGAITDSAGSIPDMEALRAGPEAYAQLSEAGRFAQFAGASRLWTRAEPARTWCRSCRGAPVGARQGFMGSIPILPTRIAAALSLLAAMTLTGFNVAFG